MVQLRTSEACHAGRHDECSGGKGTPPGVYGGWMCMCGCHREKHQPAGMKKKLVPNVVVTRHALEIAEMEKANKKLQEALRLERDEPGTVAHSLRRRIGTLEEQWYLSGECARRGNEAVLALKEENALMHNELHCDECGEPWTLLNVVCWPCHDRRQEAAHRRRE